MNSSELRKKIETQLDQLTPERLKLVSKFLDSIETVESKNSTSLRKLAPIKRGKKAQDLLRHTGKWQGEDIEECLNNVRETRSATEF